MRREKAFPPLAASRSPDRSDDWTHPREREGKRLPEPEQAGAEDARHRTALSTRSNTEAKKDRKLDYQQRHTRQYGARYGLAVRVHARRNLRARSKMGSLQLRIQEEMAKNWRSWPPIMLCIAP
jgi:hypothetical protein